MTTDADPFARLESIVEEQRRQIDRIVALTGRLNRIDRPTPLPAWLSLSGVGGVKSEAVPEPYPRTVTISHDVVGGEASSAIYWHEAIADPSFDTHRRIELVIDPSGATKLTDDQLVESVGDLLDRIAALEAVIAGGHRVVASPRVHVLSDTEIEVSDGDGAWKVNTQEMHTGTVQPCMFYAVRPMPEGEGYRLDCEPAGPAKCTAWVHVDAGSRLAPFVWQKDPR